MCYELRHDGDAQIPRKFKEDVFRQFVDSIDRNGSMAPWQKNYAFSLLPAAFGGVEGEYIDVILSKMAPKAETVPYRLTKFGEIDEERLGDDNDSEPQSGTKKKRGKRALPRKADVSGLGL